jgi:hypothetical protein
LKAPPPAYVIGKNELKVSIAALDVFDELLQSLPTVNPQSTLTFICICTYDFNSTLGRIFPNLVALVIGGILLVVSGHPHILGCSKQSGLRGGCIIDTAFLGGAVETN